MKDCQSLILLLADLIMISSPEPLFLRVEFFQDVFRQLSATKSTRLHPVGMVFTIFHVNSSIVVKFPTVTVAAIISRRQEQC